MEPTAPFSLLNSFWQTQLQIIEESELDFKNFSLPLARIKKVMKVDDDVKPMMISAEAPVVFAKACEIFILELTLRAWIQTEDNKRRTLQRNDVAMAIGKNDTFDFLIDIVPREEIKTKRSDVVDYRPPMGADPYFYANPMASYANPMVAQPDQAALLYQQQQMNLLRQQFINQQLPHDQSESFSENQ